MDVETRYTVRQLAKLAGITARTLHHYDDIGLLRPPRDPRNGYRLYDRPALLRLQQIMFFRELGLSLEDILAVLDQPTFDLPAALETHRQALLGRRQRLDQLIETIEHTIEHLKGRYDMENKDLFAGFSEEEEKRYTEEARLHWGDSEAYQESQRRYSRLTPAEKKQMMDEGNRLYHDIVAVIPLGPGSPAAQQTIARWHQHLRYFYEPSKEMLLGLGELYNDDPRFAENFARMHPDLAKFMREAIRIYVNNLK